MGSNDWHLSLAIAIEISRGRGMIQLIMCTYKCTKELQNYSQAFYCSIRHMTNTTVYCTYFFFIYYDICLELVKGQPYLMDQEMIEEPEIIL